MDDQIFDKKTALDWIKAVEASGKSFRDDHVYPKLNKIIEQTSPKTILDIGCGQGICSDKINIEQSKYVGIEPSPFLLERAKQLYESENKKFINGNAYDIPLENESIDFAFSVMVWHLLSDLTKAASELNRVLAKNGSFLIISANPMANEAWKAFYPDAKISGKKLEGTMAIGDMVSRDTLYFHSLEEIRESFNSNGLSIDNTDTFLKIGNTQQSNLLIAIQGRK